MNENQVGLLLGAFGGTILGFLLSWLKESAQNKPKLKTIFKNGALRYMMIEDLNKQTLVDRVEPEEASMLTLNFNFDVYNIGNQNTFITDILIFVRCNGHGMYFSPKIHLPYENKTFENTSFNVESNKMYAVEANVNIENDSINNYLFNNINYDHDSPNSLKLTIIIKQNKGKDIKINVNPMAIFTF